MPKKLSPGRLMIGILIIATKINSDTKIILRLRNNGFMYSFNFSLKEKKVATK